MLQSDASITLARTVASDQFRVNDDATTSHRISPFDEHGQFVNTRAVAPALFFNGNGGRGISTLTNQAISTYDTEYSCMLDVPASASLVTQDLGICALTSSTTTAIQANAMVSYFSSGTLTIRNRIYGAATTDYNAEALDATPWAGKSVLFEVKRTGGACIVKVNSITQSTTASTGGTPPTWSGSITNTYFTFGQVDSTYSFIGRMWNQAWHNFALSDAESTKLAENGGVPEDKYKWGSQAVLLASDFSAGVGSYTDGSGGNTLTGNVDTDADGAGVPPSDDWLKVTRTTSTGAILVQGPSSSPLTRRKVFEVTADVFVPVGSTITHLKATVPDFGTTYENSRLSPTGGISLTAGAVTAFRQVIATDAATANASRNQNALFRSCNSAGTATSIATGNPLYLKNVKVRELGAVCFFPCDEGIGWQAKDQSSNALDATLSTSGISHTIKKPFGTVRGTLTWSGTHEGKSLLGQAIMESDCLVDSISDKASAASSGSGMTIGTTASATRYLGLTTYGTPKVHKRGSEISNGGAPGGTAASNLDIILDPDTANYTGSHAVEVSIKRTLGTAT